MGNYINLPYSLAMRHQEYQCHISAEDNVIDLISGSGNLTINLW